MDKTPQKIILVAFPFTNPAARYRIWQYQKRFVESGYHVDSVVFPRDYDFKTYLKIYVHLLSNGCRGDVIINNRVFYFQNPILLLFSMLLLRFRYKHIFDFDDAIYLNPVPIKKNRGFKEIAKKIYRLLVRGGTNRSGRFWTAVAMLRLSSIAFCGNDYLNDFAKKYSKKSIVLPTVLEIDERDKKKVYNSGHPVILGWLGTADNLKYLELLENVFKQLREKYGDNIRLKVVTSKEYFSRSILTLNKPWSLQEQRQDLQSFDIGLMPLSGEDWVLGKCGFKSILYHSVGLPVVASDRGVSGSIVVHGESGFLAKDDNEWLLYLSCLIDDSSMRQSMGKRGFEHIKDNFSINTGFGIIQRSLEALL